MKKKRAATAKSAKQVYDGSYAGVKNLAHLRPMVPCPRAVQILTAIDMIRRKENNQLKLRRNGYIPLVMMTMDRNLMTPLEMMILENDIQNKNTGTNPLKGRKIVALLQNPK